VELLPELKKIEASGGPGTPIFNTDLFGGYLMFFTPGLRVFIDDRFELYANGFLRKYMDANDNNPSQINNWAKEYGFNYALTLNGIGFEKYLSRSSNWHLIKKTKAGSLYQKIQP
jgi:hypothetical protein